MLIHGPTGNAYKLSVYEGVQGLLCCGLMTNPPAGYLENDDNWGEVEFHMIEEESAQEARAIQFALDYIRLATKERQENEAAER